MEVSFPFPYQPPYWRVKPANFLAHFVGHEGPGSLHAYLKNKGWVTSLSAGPQDLANGFSMFKVTIYMTKEGFRKSSYIISHCSISSTHLAICRELQRSDPCML